MKKSTFETSVICLLLLLATAALPALGSDWAQFQKDEANSGVTGDSAPIESPDTTWTNTLTGSIFCTPVTGDDKVFAVDAQGVVWANYFNGTEAWNNSDIEGSGGGYSFELATPAYARNSTGAETLFVALSDGNASTNTELYALNAETGAIRWPATDIDVNQTNTPVLYYDELVYFATCHVNGLWTTDGGNYYCYYANNGTQKWVHESTTDSGYYWAGAAIIGNYIVFGDDAGYLTSLNRTTGAFEDDMNVSTLFNGDDTGKIRSSIATNENKDRLYFTTYRYGETGYDDCGYCFSIGFNSSTGDFVETGAQRSANIEKSTSTPAVYNDRVYFGDDDYGTSMRKMHCLNASNLSEEHWNYSIDRIQASPVVSTFYDDVYIYATTNRDKYELFCLRDDGTSATKVWSLEDEGGLQGVAVSGGWIFAGGSHISGFADETTYDFAVRAGTDKWAYNYQVDDVKPSSATVPNDYEFSTTEYEDIASDDDTNYANSQASSGKYAAQRFVFSIDSSMQEWIATINVTWNGKAYNEDGNGAYLYVWNGTGYEELDSNGVATDDTLTGEVTAGISNYINSGNVTMLVVQKSQTDLEDSRLETDYVKLVITP